MDSSLWEHSAQLKSFFVIFQDIANLQWTSSCRWSVIKDPSREKMISLVIVVV
jgi:hypothetical protein